MGFCRGKPKRALLGLVLLFLGMLAVVLAAQTPAPPDNTDADGQEDAETKAKEAEQALQAQANREQCQWLADNLEKNYLKQCKLVYQDRGTCEPVQKYNSREIIQYKFTKPKAESEKKLRQSTLPFTGTKSGSAAQSSVKVCNCTAFITTEKQFRLGLFLCIDHMGPRQLDSTC